MRAGLLILSLGGEELAEPMRAGLLILSLGGEELAEPAPTINNYQLSIVNYQLSIDFGDRRMMTGTVADNGRGVETC
ncbi:hypothetical protein B9R42_17715 [Arthrospira platensis PCC 7345]